MNLAKTFAPFSHTIFLPILSHPVPSQRLYEDISCPVISVDMAGGQAKSKTKKNGWQPLILEDQGGVLGVYASVFKLTI